MLCSFSSSLNDIIAFTINNGASEKLPQDQKLIIRRASSTDLEALGHCPVQYCHPGWECCLFIILFYFPGSSLFSLKDQFEAYKSL